MGVDTYILKPDVRCDMNQPFVLRDYPKLSKYSNHAVMADEVFINWPDTFQSKGKFYRDYLLDSIMDGVYRFKDKAGAEMIFAEGDLVLFHEDVLTLYCREVGYMRKNMNDLFYEVADKMFDEIDEWADDITEYNDFCTILTKQELKKFIVKYCEDIPTADAQLLSKFKRGCFAYVSW